MNEQVKEVVMKYQAKSPTSRINKEYTQNKAREIISQYSTISDSSERIRSIQLKIEQMRLRSTMELESINSSKINKENYQPPSQESIIIMQKQNEYLDEKKNQSEIQQINLTQFELKSTQIENKENLIHEIDENQSRSEHKLPHFEQQSQNTNPYQINIDKHHLERRDNESFENIPNKSTSTQKQVEIIEILDDNDDDNQQVQPETSTEAQLQIQNSCQEDEKKHVTDEQLNQNNENKIDKPLEISQSEVRQEEHQKVQEKQIENQESSNKQQEQSKEGKQQEQDQINNHNDEFVAENFLSFAKENQSELFQEEKQQMQTPNKEVSRENKQFDSPIGDHINLVSDQKSSLSFRPNQNLDQDDINQIFSFILCDKMKSGKESQFKCDIKSPLPISMKSKSIKKKPSIQKSLNNSEKKFLSPMQKRMSQSKFILSEIEEDYIIKSISPFKGIQNFSQEKIKSYDQNEIIEKAIKKLEITEIHTDVRIISEAALKNHSLLYSGKLNTLDKSLLYQLLSLVIDSLIVIVTPHHNHLKQKLRKVNSSISWAALNSQVTAIQRECVLKHLRSTGLRMLFIHPEMIPYLNFKLDGATHVFFDEAHSYLHEMMIGQVMWNVNTQKLISQISPKCVHIFVPFMHALNEINPPFKYKFQLYKQQPDKLLQNPATSSRDEDPLKQLVSLFRSPRLYRKSGILVYCNSRINVEQACSYLTKNGYRCGYIHLQKQEIYRQACYYDFAKGNMDILVLPSGFLLPEGFKNYVYLTVHLNLPKNVETWYLDISDINLEANSHIFLSSQLFHEQRAQICNQFIDLDSIDTLLSTQLFKNIQQDDNRIGDWFRQNDRNYINLHAEQKNIKDKLIIIKIQETINQLEINREILQRIIDELQKIDWVQVMLVMPEEVLIKLNSKPDSLGAKNRVVMNLISYGRKCIQGCAQKKHSHSAYRCTLKNLMTNYDGTVQDVIEELKQLQNDKQLSFEIIEESIFVKVCHTPVFSELQAKILQLYAMLRRETFGQLSRFDTMYLMMRVGSFHSLDHMWKQVKYRSDGIEQGNIGKFVEEYFLSDTFLNSEMIFQDKSLLPFSKLESQREKTNLMTDLYELLNGESIEEMKISWAERENFANHAVKILQGLREKYPSMNEWKVRQSLAQWKKYNHFEYETLHQLVHELVISMKSPTQKKLKL